MKLLVRTSTAKPSKKCKAVIKAFRFVLFTHKQCVQTLDWCYTVPIMILKIKHLLKAERVKDSSKSTFGTLFILMSTLGNVSQVDTIHTV